MTAAIEHVHLDFATRQVEITFREQFAVAPQVLRVPFAVWKGAAGLIVNNEGVAEQTQMAQFAQRQGASLVAVE